MNDARDNFSSQISNVLNTAKSNTQALIQEPLSQAKSSIEEASNLAWNYYETILNYDSQRILGQMALVLLYCIPILFIGLGGAAKQPGCMKW
jgi:hypothetical protein